jgi:MFS family permease
MTQTNVLQEEKLKWPEIYSLAFLNAAVVISWIAYHEYQPVLVQKFEFDNLVDFLIASKAIILVIVPPIAGIVADHLLRKRGKFFTIFTVGIGSTAMVFMVVATMIGVGPLSSIKSVLPFMIILWLIAMNIFISSAHSMIDAFAPAKKLPIVVGFLFLVTELLYALEPVVVELVHFFGDTLTFIVGGILIASSGYVFHRVSSNEVLLRKQELVDQPVKKTKPLAFIAIVIIGMQLGLGKAFIVEFFPDFMDQKFLNNGLHADVIALGLLALAAFFAFGISKEITKRDFNQSIPLGFIGLGLGILLILFAPSVWMYIIGGVITALAFGLLNIAGLPYAFKHLSVRNITYGIGIFIGASELFTGMFEYFLR